MEQERDVQVIFFKDLIFAVLYQWKKLLIAALVLALVFGGYQLFAVRSSAPAEIDEDTTSRIANLQELLEAAQTAVESHTSYMADSILMNMDPSQVYTAGADLYISTDYQIMPDMIYQNTDKALPLLRAYQTSLNNDDMLSTASASLGVPSRFLSELVKFEIFTDLSNTMSITVIYPNIEGAELILATLLQDLDTTTAQISQSIYPHTVSLTTYQTDARTDWTLVQAQTSASERLVALNKSVETIKADLNKLQSSVQTETLSPVSAAIIGAVLGIAAVAVCACAYHISTEKVYSERVLKNRTDIKVLGSLPVASKRSGFDTWLRRLEGRSTSPNQVSVIAATIRNYCTQAPRLIIVGDSEPTAREPLLQALKDIDVDATDLGSLLHDTKAMATLSQYDAVLLVEQCGRSRYCDVYRAQQLLADQGKQILGCVLLDG